MVKRKRKNMAGSSSGGTKFISLPDNVFTVIFSFLTMKQALYTCVSCKKLKHLMTVIPNVKFKEKENGGRTKKREFVESVSRFLNNHDGLVRKFSLSFCPLRYRYRSDVRNWISSVVKDGIEELDLVFGYANNLMILPDLLTAATLKVLKLEHCIVDLPSITGFKYLETLLLGSMNISNSVMSLLCCHCMSLQHLTLQNCFGFTEIEIVDPKSKLESLGLIDYSGLHDPVALKISSLKMLFIDQRIMNFYFVGSPHIDELILFRPALLRITPMEIENMKNRIIDSLENVRSLQLGELAFECFTAYRSNQRFTKLERIMLLDFNVSLKNIKGLTKLISQADGVKKFDIWISENSATHYEMNTNLNFERVREHFLNAVNVLPRTVAFRNSTVRVIYIERFTGTFNELSHIKFMLAHFPHLRLLKVTPIKYMDEDESRAYAEIISSFPRVSTNVYMVVGSENFVIYKLKKLGR